MNRKIKYALLDLDGTLISINWQRDMRMYFQKLQEVLKSYHMKKSYFFAVKRAGDKMMADKSGKTLNIERYLHYLTRYSKIDLEKNRELYWVFYNEKFPSFKFGVKEVDGAHELIERLKKYELTLVLATNPVFPLSSIKERMSWGNIDPDNFNHITHIENHYYCKPSVHYYREILEKVGAKADECMMVGDDYRRDIKPAKKLGMTTWWHLHMKTRVRRDTLSGRIHSLVEILQNPDWEKILKQKK